MILTDREIQVFIEHEKIIIDPLPGIEKYSSTSVDLTLDKKIKFWDLNGAKGVETIFCPGSKDYKYSEVEKAYCKDSEIKPAGYVLEPRAFILAWTSETDALPVHARIAARIEGKSSLARLGLAVHITAPTIHAGFQGQIQLEMCNHGPIRIKLVRGMPVCQLIFEQTLGTPSQGYTGMFQNQIA
ncbi:MAG: dCTP deaminase [Lentisphaerae bacterium]|nr:dCTP deaminase [Lentisphaerota bacterium]